MLGVCFHWPDEWIIQSTHNLKAKPYTLKGWKWAFVWIKQCHFHTTSIKAFDAQVWGFQCVWTLPDMLMMLCLGVEGHVWAQVSHPPTTSVRTRLRDQWQQSGHQMWAHDTLGTSDVIAWVEQCHGAQMSGIYRCTDRTHPWVFGVGLWWFSWKQTVRTGVVQIWGQLIAKTWIGWFHPISVSKFWWSQWIDNFWNALY